MLQRRLVINPDSIQSNIVILQNRSYRIGRDIAADITLSSKNVSATHCSLSVNEKCVEIVDLGSTNGTYINGKRIKKATLSNGDMIILGDCPMRYEENSAERSGELHKTAIYKLPGENKYERILKMAARLKCGGHLQQYEINEILDSLELYIRNNLLLETLYSLLEKVLSVSDRDSAIALLLCELRRLLGLEIASLYLTKENHFGILENQKIEWSGEYPVVSRSVLRNVIENKKPVVIDDVSTSAEGTKTLIKFKIRSVLCFPVLNREGTVMAVVYCVSRQPGQLDILSNDNHFINACSSFIALILENLQVIERERAAASAEAQRMEQNRYTPIISRLRRERENLSLKLNVMEAENDFFGLDAKEYSRLREFVLRAAPSCLPVLITGETGVGKTLFAKFIHRASAVEGRFVIIDCTTIPRELLESELFGHEKGAFTGAHIRKTGKVKNADGGTLFIDEIGELDYSLQAKLLRFIQSGEYEPLGSSTTQHSSARIIAATNRDLRTEVSEKRFREDLYYRLNVLSIELPPLRKCPDMIIRFAEYFRNRYARQLNPSAGGFTDAARTVLVSHSWPGNIRELENTILRALVNVKEGDIDASHLALETENLTSAFSAEISVDLSNDALDLKAARERIDRVYISHALAATGRNVSKAADLLKISRNSLMELIKKYRL